MNLAAHSFVFLVLLVGAGCRSAYVPEGPVQWTLVRVEIDERALPNTGSLPLFQPPDQATGGLAPMAFGYLQITDSGKVACEVKVREPVLAYTGESSVHEYTLVAFYGLRSQRGDRFVLTDAPSQQPNLGAATILHVYELSGDRYKVQAATGERLLPYVYYFDASPAWRNPVRMPYVQ